MENPGSRQQWGYGLPDQAQPAPAAARTARAGWMRHLAGDVTGGATAALLTIPASMGYGLLALAALGEPYVGVAVLAGLYATVAGCVVAMLLGANTTMIYSPRSIVTFMIGAFVLHSLVNSTVPAIQGAPPATLFTMALLLVFLAGFFQALLGWFGFGSIAKYIPAPVIAGFQNAAAILIFCSQLNALFGFRHPVPVLSIPLQLDAAQPLTLLVGVLTCALILRGARLTRRIPPTILGLLGGTATYYALALAGLGSHLGSTIGPIPLAVPEPGFLLEFGHMVLDPQFAPAVPVLVAGAASLAIVASLDALLCARLVESDTGRRMAGNRELTRLGIGNMVAASFGGIANGINLGSSFANHRSGARTPLSLLVHTGVIVLVLVTLAPAISWMPRVVIAGMLMAVAIQLVDRWTLQILRRLAAREFTRARSVLLDLSIIAIVAVVAVALDIVLAVVIGVAVTILFFLFRMSKSVIRRSYRCDVVHSRKTREPALMNVLAENGARILVFELEGPIFFGTAENLAACLESAAAEGASCVILDLKRVNEIDSTGAKILLSAHDRLTRDGGSLLLSGIPEAPQIAAFLNDMGVTAALTRGRIFPDLDRAIEWAEDRLILASLGDIESGSEFPFSRFDALAGLTETELAAVRAVLARRAYAPGTVVFREGEPGDELLIIAKGSASVRLRLDGSDREARLVTFSAGTVFGEVALLDREARSATVTADVELVCYVLTRAAFDRLAAVHPSVSIKLLTNLGREISGRLRRANRTIYQLSS